MKSKIKKTPAVPAIALAGEKALRAAVAEVVAEHKRTGKPLAVWRDGYAVLVSADKAVAHVAEARGTYGAKPRK